MSPLVACKLCGQIVKESGSHDCPPPGVVTRQERAKTKALVMATLVCRSQSTLEQIAHGIRQTRDRVDLDGVELVAEDILKRSGL